jgi:diguanylate cyclase (GGDEF)-like protein/PAS domain S-box-containing protein
LWIFSSIFHGFLIGFYVANDVKDKPVNFHIALDPQAILTKVDQAFCDYLSLSQNELVGCLFTDTTPEFHRSQFQEFLIELLEKKSTGSITLHHKNTNGVLQPIHWIFQPDFLHSGTPVVIIGTGNLAFDTNSPTNLPQHSRNFLGKTALDSIQDVVFITDRLDRIILFNQRFKEMLQPELQNSQILESNLQSITPFLFPQYDQDKQTVLQSVQDVTSESSFELNNEIRSFLNHRKAILEDGDFNYLITVMQEITPLKQFEIALQDCDEKYRSFIQNFHGIVFRTDINFAPIFINGSVSQITGYSSQTLLADNQLWDEIIHPDDQAWVNDARMRLKNEIGAVVELEYRIIHKNGEIRWINELMQNTVDEMGNLRFIQGTCYDVTERKKSEETLNQINQELHDTVRLLQLRNQQFMLLNEMGDMLQSSRQVEDAYAIISDFAPLLFPGHSGAIYILDNSDQQYHTVTYWGENPPQTKSFPSNDCWAVRRGRMFSVLQPTENILCSHAKEEMDFYKNKKERLFSKSPTNGCVCIPMLSHGELFGVMYLHLSGNYESEEIIRLAQTIAERTALAIANLNLRNQLHVQSIRDPLTGLFNRRFMQESLEREVHKVQRTNRGVSVAMIDIDRFKDFNDGYGHDIGDSIIQQVGQYLQTHTRIEDVVCRFGGDEFLIILPEVTSGDAHHRIQELGREISELQIQFQENQFEKVTISAGVSQLPEFAVTAEELIRTADTALYQAKELGRNRVEIFKPREKME